MPPKRSAPPRKAASRPAPKPPLEDVQFDPEDPPAEFGDEFAITTGSGGAALIPVSLLRTTPMVRQMAAHTQRLVMQRRELDQEIEEHVIEMREMGASWGIVGWSVGTTSDAALKRWGTDANGQRR